MQKFLKTREIDLLSPLQRAQVEFILMYMDFRRGRGDEVQRRAFEEYEWRRIEDSCNYFIRHYGYLMEKSGEVKKWEPWDFQIELFDAWQAGESTCAVKARQLGVTTCSSHFGMWEVIVKDAVKWYAISQNEESAKDLISRIQATIDRLPEWVTRRGARGKESGIMTIADKPGTRTGRRKQSEGVMRFVCGMSQLLVLTSTPESVQGKAGKFILDEFSKHRNQRSVWHLVWPSFQGGGQCIMIANGNGKDTFYHIYQGAKAGKNNLVSRFYSWHHDPTRDKTWYEAALEAYLLDNPDSDIYAFKAMYPSDENEAFFLTGNSRFSLAKLNEMEKKASSEKIKARLGMIVTEVVEDEEGRKHEKLVFKPHRQGKLKVWEEPKENEIYVAGMDTSGGKRDYAVMDVYRVDLDKDRLIQVAQYRAVVEPEYFGFVGLNLGRFYSDAYVNIERNNHGQTAIDVMKEDYGNLYMQIKTDKYTDQDMEYIGYSAQKASKAKLIDGLSYWIAAEKIMCRSQVTMSELAIYEVKENETTGAPAGEHDDCVIAAGLAVMAAKDLMSRRWNLEEQALAFEAWEV